MPNRTKIIFFYCVSALFLFLNLFFLIKQETLLAATLPVVLIFALLAFYKLDTLLLLITFFTPLSLPLSELVPNLPFDMFLPTEPMLLGMLVLFLFKQIQTGGPGKVILLHPVSIAIYGYLGWMLITSATSTMPVVSLKFWISKIWFVAAFYFMGIFLFSNTKNIYRFVGLYVGAFTIVIFYAWSRHLSYGLNDNQAAHFVMNPFYKDHTSYGAMLAFFIPFVTGVLFFREIRSKYRYLAAISLIILLTALILSYTRAAWLGLFVGLGVLFVFKLKIRFRPLFITAVSIFAFTVAFQSQILAVMERNNKESSTNLATHISSMTNISSDASNLERINRWNCAIRMFEQKPVFGWGPGTYMFNYAPFQLTRLRTIISTNSANRGNAHSEYLGPLAESGLLGMISFIVLLIVVYYVAVHAYMRSRDRESRMILLATIIGLTSYFIHGFLNNFLDTDKAAIPFWGFIAIIVMIDLRSQGKDLMTTSAKSQLSEDDDVQN